MYIAYVHFDNKELAIEELTRVCAKPTNVIGRLVFLDKVPPVTHLAYTEFIINVQSRITDISKFTGPLNIKGSYKVEMTNLDTEYEEPFDFIYRALENPQVEMKKPTTVLRVIKCEGMYYLGEQIFYNTKEYTLRKAHLREKLHPTSISPKLAKAMVNLTQVTSGTIYDPFCGTGGILLEAHENGLQTIGSDIDAKMVEYTRKHVPTCKVSVLDATTTTQKCDAIVTDPPYGKNTKNISLDLYEKFLLNAQKLTNNIVLCLPDTIKFTHPGWDVTFQTTIYIHKSLTRKVWALQRNHE